VSKKTPTPAKQTPKQLKKQLQNLGVDKKVASQLVNQAASTGKVGLTKNEANFLINQATAGKLDNLTASNLNAKAVLGSSTSRVQYNQDVRQSSVESPVGGGGGGSSVSQSYYVPEPYIPPPPPPVKVPERDVVNFANPVIDAATITNLLFENIGGIEMSQLVRHDTIDTPNNDYTIISNLSSLKNEYSPLRLLYGKSIDYNYKNEFQIDLSQRIPSQRYLERNNLSNYIYIDFNGDLVIELENMNTTEVLDIELDVNGTIYKVG
jgi:hypothetical protein